MLANTNTMLLLLIIYANHFDLNVEAKNALGVYMEATFKKSANFTTIDYMVNNGEES